MWEMDSVSIKDTLSHSSGNVGSFADGREDEQMLLQDLDHLGMTDIERPTARHVDAERAEGAALT